MLSIFYSAIPSIFSLWRNVRDSLFVDAFPQDTDNISGFSVSKHAQLNNPLVQQVCCLFVTRELIHSSRKSFLDVEKRIRMLNPLCDFLGKLSFVVEYQII